MTKKSKKSSLFRGPALLEPNEEEPVDTKAVFESTAVKGKACAASTAAKNTEHERLVGEIIRHHMCAKCNKACVVLYPSGKHRQFTVPELTQMAQILVSLWVQSRGRES